MVLKGTDATLGRVSLRMARSLDLPELLGEITRGLVHDLDAAMARIWLLQPEDKEHLRLVASAGLSERLDGSYARVAIGTMKIGQIATTRTSVCSNDVQSDPRFSRKAWLAENQLVAFAGYPLTFDDELLGVLAMFARRSLTDVEFEQLGVFAAQASIAIKNARLFTEVTDLTRRLTAENTYLKEELRTDTTGIIGESAAIRRVLSELDHVAPTASTVLLHGETGTGKELFARALHERSTRRDGPLVKVNCAALAPTLMESELFGHEKGAFTGAVQRRVGRFELASGGTLFLDEIGELPLDAQAKLLRVLQEREVERVGGTQSIRVDLRIVAATNRDLSAEVKANRFRSDLYFRLNVFPIEIPPLRERREDVPLIAGTFLDTMARRLGVAPKELDEDALAYLQAYDWPGNVRELQNVLERASILARGSRIGVSDLPELTMSEDTLRDSRDPTAELPLKDRVNAYERSLVAEALRMANGNQSEAARALKTNRATLQYKMKLYGL